MRPGPPPGQHSPPMQPLPTIPPVSQHSGIQQQPVLLVATHSGGSPSLIPGVPIQAPVMAYSSVQPMSPGMMEQQLMMGGQIRPLSPMSPMMAGPLHIVTVGDPRAQRPMSPHEQQQAFYQMRHMSPQQQPVRAPASDLYSTLPGVVPMQQQQQQQQQQQMGNVPRGQYPGHLRMEGEPDPRRQQEARATEERLLEEAREKRLESYRERLEAQQGLVRKQAAQLSELKERERRALAHPGAVEVAPEAFDEENLKMRHIQMEIQAGERKINTLTKELMQGRDVLDQQISINNAAAPVHPRVLEELQGEHAWLRERVKQRELEVSQKRESNIVLEKSSGRLKTEHMIKEDDLNRQIASLEHKLRQKRERVQSVRAEAEEARGALRAREVDGQSKMRLGKREERGGLLREMEAHMQYVEAINQIQDLEAELVRLEKQLVHVNRAADRARRQLQNREDIETALASVRISQPAPKQLCEHRTDDDQFYVANLEAGTIPDQRVDRSGYGHQQTDLFGNAKSPNYDNTWT